MKPKHFLIAVVLIVSSCKVTDRNISGIYQSTNSNSQTLKINLDHTFLYIDFDALKILKHQDRDSSYFITKGKWRLAKKILIINSFESTYSDTSRVIGVFKTTTKSKESNFSFKDISGNTISFDRVDDERGNFTSIVDKQYLSYDIDLTKHKILTFSFYSYQPWTFTINDTIPANFTIIIAPYYKQSYFNNKFFTVKRGRIIDGKIKFKRDKSVK